MENKTAGSIPYTFVIVGTDIKLTFTGNTLSSEHEHTTQILRDDTIQTVKKKLLMQLNRVYTTDVAYEELFLNAHVNVNSLDPAQLFRDALMAKGNTSYLSQSDVLVLCKKYGVDTNTAVNKDKYTLPEFTALFVRNLRFLDGTSLYLR